MVSKLFCGGLMVLALCLVSCGQDQIVDTTRGVYKMEIRRSGDVDKFATSSVVLTGPASDGLDLIYTEKDPTGRSLYVLDNEDNRATSDMFRSSENCGGLVYTGSTFCLNNTGRDSMRIEVIGYLDDREICRETRTFYSFTEEELKAIDPDSEASAINFRFQLQDYVRN